MEARRGEANPESPFKRMVAADFVQGVIHHAALQQGGTLNFNVNDTHVHAAMKKAFDILQAKADDSGKDVRFRVILHPAYGDSEVVGTQLSRLLFDYGGQGVDGIDGSYVNLHYDAGHPITEHMGERRAAEAPGLYEELAGVFLDSLLERPPTEN